jgi:hypothetical protein
MEVITRAEVPAVELRTEEVELASLKRKVVVRGRLLQHTLRLAQLRESLIKPLEGESEADAEARAVAEISTRQLAMQVLAGDGEPMWTAAQWGIWAGSNAAEFAQLQTACDRVSGTSVEIAEKN